MQKGFFNMRLKKLFVCAVIIAASVFSMTACSGTSAKDAEIAQKLVGGWVYLNDEDIAYNDDGSLLNFKVFEFTGSSTKIHVVSDSQIMSWYVNDYEIKNQKYTVMVDGKPQYEGIGFNDDGNLVLYTDSTQDEFRKLTDEEIAEYNIPIGQLLASEIQDNASATETEDTANE